MKPMPERLRTLRLITILIALLLTGNGCSALMASRKAPDVSGIAIGSTLQEVRHVLGDPESSKTRGDGTRIDSHHIPGDVASAWQGGPSRDIWALTAQVHPLIALPASLIFEVYATGRAIYDSEKGAKDWVLVYGPNERLLYFYEVHAPPESRFEAACRPLNAMLWAQLESDQCPAWSPCLTSYLDERRRRAAVVSYTFPPTDEANFRRLLDVATDRDEERITKGEAFIKSAGLYLLDEAVPSDWRFRATRDSLNGVLSTQIEKGGCPAWLPCFATYVDELRRRAAVVGYTLSPTDEANSRRLLEVARDRDEGRITEAEALIGIAGYEGSHWSLDQALRMQLKGNGCPIWVVCVAYHESERRRRAASENSTITPEEENQMRERLKIAEDVDQGRLTKMDALEEERWRNF